MSDPFSDKIFRNSNQEIVEYDGSPVTWRISVYVLVRKGNELLMVKNKEEKLYDVIGGGVELGETFEEAITREAMEEAGAVVKIGKLLHAHLDWFSYKPGVFYQTVQLYYEAELTAELVQPTDPRTVWRGFVPLSEQPEKYPLPPIVEKVIKENIQQ